MIYNKDPKNKTTKEVDRKGAPKEQRNHNCDVKSVKHFFKAPLVNTQINIMEPVNT
jgi:hypothetical protein